MAIAGMPRVLQAEAGKFMTYDPLGSYLSKQAVESSPSLNFLTAEAEAHAVERYGGCGLSRPLGSACALIATSDCARSSPLQHRRTLPAFPASGFRP